jgi:GNAT superfamily N-acetyltransferase
MEREPGKVRRSVGGVVARADQRARVALRLGPIDAVRAAVRARRITRRQIGLVAEATPQAPPIPGSGPLQPTDALAFGGFSELVPATPPESLLELLWYERFAATGAETLLVARDGEGRPVFSTWMLSPAGQQLHRDRFLEGFHALEPDEMLMEGVFTFPHARRRGVARAGIAAACAWACGQGASRIWAYPYLDNSRILPVFAACGLTPVDVRVEVSSFGQARGHRERLREADLRVWEDAVALAGLSR